MKRLNMMYFSPTKTTKKVIHKIFDTILENDSIKKGTIINFTLPQERITGENLKSDDILLIGVPVYAGRVPNVLLKYLDTIKGENTLAIPLVLYGNRNYDDALVELSDILEKNGFKVIAAASFIGEHSFSKTLAKDRPDPLDLDMAIEFGTRIHKKIRDESYNEIKIKGNRPYRGYYIPKDKDGKSVDIRKVIPKTDATCTDCKICANICPMGSIDYEDVALLTGICIKCGACIKECPTSSKYFDDKGYLRHKHELEDALRIRREPEIFV